MRNLASIYGDDLWPICLEPYGFQNQLQQQLATADLTKYVKTTRTTFDGLSPVIRRPLHRVNLC